MRDGGHVSVQYTVQQFDSFQFFHLFFFVGSWPVASKYLWMSSSCVLGRQGWYLLYSMVYSPFPCINKRKGYVFITMLVWLYGW